MSHTTWRTSPDLERGVYKEECFFKEGLTGTCPNIYIYIFASPPPQNLPFVWTHVLEKTGVGLQT